MSSHYFIGIKIPSEFREITEVFIEKYCLRHYYKVLPHHEDLHVTLLFLGHVAVEHLSTLNKELTKIGKNNSPFSLYIDGLSYFGSDTSPRVVYLSVSECNMLNTLQQQINSSIPHMLSLPSTKRFIPHVTIAKKLKEQGSVNILKQAIEPKEVAVNAFSIFTIHPARSPKYEIVETFQLEG